MYCITCDLVFFGMDRREHGIGWGYLRHDLIALHIINFVPHQYNFRGKNADGLQILNPFQKHRGAEGEIDNVRRKRFEPYVGRSHLKTNVDCWENANDGHITSTKVILKPFNTLGTKNKTLLFNKTISTVFLCSFYFICNQRAKLLSQVISISSLNSTYGTRRILCIVKSLWSSFIWIPYGLITWFFHEFWKHAPRLGNVCSISLIWNLGTTCLNFRSTYLFRAKAGRKCEIMARFVVKQFDLIKST